VSAPSDSGEAQPAPTVRTAGGVLRLDYLIVAAVALAGGGGAGTLVTGTSTAKNVSELTVEVKTMKTELLGEIRHLTKQTDDMSQRLATCEARLHEHEKKHMHSGSQLILEGISRRIKALEDRRQ